MGRVPPKRFDVDALHVRLCERIAELHPLIVADVVRVFLEVSSLPCEQMPWSLEFAFDEDDSRIARVEARFASDPTLAIAAPEELPGYEVQLLLPKVFPSRSPAENMRTASYAPAKTGTRDSLVERFTHALAELGAYHTIETFEVLSAEVYRL